MRKFWFAVAVAVLGCIAVAWGATAAEPGITFKDKSITMIIPTTPGGSTDLSARLLARFLAKHLPGGPNIVAQNVPGGHGVSALNYVVQQVKPDGLTITTSSNSQVDPITYRAPQARYNPLDFQIIGGGRIGDNVMIIRADALPRLYDKSKKPVAMGSVAGVPRSGMRMTVWGIAYLGWNAKWVVGYPGSTDLMIALERGEIDMTSFPRGYMVDKLTDISKYKIIYLDGLGKGLPPSGRADADNAPLFTDAMNGKITDPTMKQAYDYWRAGTIFKWIALPPKTPESIRDVYRAAFNEMAKDPEFLAQADTALEGFTPVSAETMEGMIRELAATSDEAIAAFDGLMRTQGLNPAKAESKSEKGKGKKS
ncbi:MAG: Bug family tripartite tricarboxylate transporter substrate binding protein [Gemmatimonas sp.]